MPIAGFGSLYTSKLTHRFEMRLPWRRTSAYSLIGVEDLKEDSFVMCGVYKPLYDWHGKFEWFIKWLKMNSRNSLYVFV